MLLPNVVRIVAFCNICLSQLDHHLFCKVLAFEDGLGWKEAGGSFDLSFGALVNLRY